MTGPKLLVFAFFRRPRELLDHRGREVLISAQLSVTFLQTTWRAPLSRDSSQDERRRLHVGPHNKPPLPPPPPTPRGHPHQATVPDIRKGMRIFSPVSGWMMACNRSVMIRIRPMMRAERFGEFRSRESFALGLKTEGKFGRINCRSADGGLKAWEKTFRSWLRYFPRFCCVFHTYAGRNDRALSVQYPLCRKIKTDGNLFPSFASALRRSADWRGTEGISLLQLVKDEGAVKSTWRVQRRPGP